MKHRNILVAVVVLALSGGLVAQQAESLGDVARRLRDHKNEPPPPAAQNQATPAVAPAPSEPPGESLGDAAKRMRLGSALSVPEIKDVPKPLRTPLTELQLMAWVAGGLHPRAAVPELLARGTTFAPSADFLATMTKGGASDAILRALEKAPRFPDAAHADPAELDKLAMVSLARKQKEYRGALTELMPVLQAHPETSDLYVTMGLIFLAAEEDSGLAVRSFGKAVELAPGVAFAHGLLSYSYYRLRDGAHAIPEALIFVAMEPDNEIAHKDLGMAFEVSGMNQKALDEYEKGLKLQPDDGDIYYDRAIVYMNMNRNTEAIDDLDKAARLKPDNWSIKYNLGIVLKKAGRFDEAAERYKEAKAIAPDELRIRQNLGKLYCDTRQYQAAIGEFTELLKKNPGWNMARPCLRDSLRAIGRLAEAQKVQEEYLRQEGRD